MEMLLAMMFARNRATVWFVCFITPLLDVATEKTRHIKMSMMLYFFVKKP